MNYDSSKFKQLLKQNTSNELRTEYEAIVGYHLVDNNGHARTHTHTQKKITATLIHTCMCFYCLHRKLSILFKPVSKRINASQSIKYTNK